MLQLSAGQPLRERRVKCSSRLSRGCVRSVPQAGLPVAEHGPLGSRGRDGQLEGRVEVVLLLIRAVNHLPSSDHQETRIPQVGGVEPVTLPVQNDDAGCAAACRRTRGGKGCQGPRKQQPETPKMEL